MAISSRAGRLGIKEIGYSDWLLYGIREEALKESITESFSLGLKTELMHEGSILIDALSLWILIGYHYLGRRYKEFLQKTFSLKNVSKNAQKEVEEFLFSHVIYIVTTRECRSLVFSCKIEYN